MFKHFGFIGLGLIGGSIARSLRELDPAYTITAYCRHKELSADIREAISSKVINDAVFTLEGLADCDLIFLCAPVEANIRLLEPLAGVLSPSTILTDVGSVKSGIHVAARENGLAARFIGGHPMTGSERSGFSNSNSLLMENAYYAITADPECPQELVSEFVELVKSMKSIPVVLSPDIHDDSVSAISHVPHLIAAQLVNLVRTADHTDTMRMLAAGGFKDITRIASSSPELWEGILSQNKQFVLPTLKQYINLLQEAYDSVAESSQEEVKEIFAEAGKFRSSLSERKGVLPTEYVLYADIKDETGAIAMFATLLAAHNISMKNIGIVHNRSYERGVLRLEFYNKDALESAFRVLSQHGYTLYR